MLHFGRGAKSSWTYHERFSGKTSLQETANHIETETPILAKAAQGDNITAMKTPPQRRLRNQHVDKWWKKAQNREALINKRKQFHPSLLSQRQYIEGSSPLIFINTRIPSDLRAWPPVNIRSPKHIKGLRALNPNPIFASYLPPTILGSGVKRQTLLPKFPVIV